MSANYLHSNAGLTSLISPQQQLVTQHKSISASNGSINIGTQFHTTYSQPYQQISVMDPSWTPIQQGLCVNGINKLMSVYPGQPMSDFDRGVVSQSSDVSLITFF